jgi:hypothetical protein
MDGGEEIERCPSEWATDLTMSGLFFMNITDLRLSNIRELPNYLSN